MNPIIFLAIGSIVQSTAIVLVAVTLIKMAKRK